MTLTGGAEKGMWRGTAMGRGLGREIKYKVKMEMETKGKETKMKGFVSDWDPE